ncbi:hypothetical protein [uncultured Streptomyces sp.]|uniref:hypothetical protein n=1 Tax=uncultured Streptomyces sp. TaxID=174707 RepID=UPI002630CFCA|nr:hypothetical protein [uncultured Streptomyces sp.]
MQTTPMTAAAWLATADPDPDHAARWFESAGIVLLPLGTVWSAVRCGEHDGLAAAATVTGPVIHDPAGRAVYFLIPPTTTTWDVAGSHLLGVACWLTVPAPVTTQPPGPYWIQPPDGSGRLVDVAALAAALTARQGAGA